MPDAPRHAVRLALLLLLTLVAALALAGTASAKAKPFALYSITPKSPTAGHIVTLDARGSSCGPGTPCFYRWDGYLTKTWTRRLGTGRRVKLMVKAAGTQRVRLTVFNRLHHRVARTTRTIRATGGFSSRDGTAATSTG
ncbi:MAG TPA: hypothetical protein VNT55_21190, partial [Baekduia sp.]|nr:hypothetical protein [Baekduia sp.]